MSQTMDQTDKFTLTRYLYSKKEVEQSLILSLLEHKNDEALFWAYELYYSGFDVYVFKFVLKTFNLFYKKENTQLESFIVKTMDEWNQDRSKDYLLGSIVYTIAMRDYQIDDFIHMHKRDDIKCFLVPRKNESNKKKFIIKMTMKDIDIYTPIEPLKTKNWKILSSACRYTIRTNVNHIFDTERPENIEDVYNSNRWLYYAVKSPIWEKRVLCFEGKIDDESQEVVFPNDDMFDDFYDCWGYEPDEQPREVKEMLMGVPNEKQITLEEFCSLYCGVLIENYSNEEVTNSMLYT